MSINQPNQPNQPNFSDPINPQISSETISQLVIRNIIEHNGIGSSVFGVTGATWYLIDDVLSNAVNDKKLKYIHVSTESGGVYMAAYEAEILNKVGIHFVSAGPGICMAATGLDSINYESKQCIIFLGIPNNNFQYIDPYLFSSITRKTFYIDATTINPENILNSAFEIAKHGTNQFYAPGPVIVAIQDTIWNLPYLYTNNVIPYHLEINSFSDMLDKIFHSVSPTSLIIIRVGERVDIEHVKLLAQLTVHYPNFYLQLVVSGKNRLNTFKYTNVGNEGPLSNQIVNNNYSNVNVIVEIGVGITYSLIEYLDVAPLAPNATIWYIQAETLVIPPISSNINNTVLTEVNTFIVAWVKDICNRYPKFTTFWPNQNIEKYNFDYKALKTYTNQLALNNNYDSTIPQGTLDILTTISITGHVLSVIYSCQKQSEKMCIDDNNLYVADTGLVSFISITLINHVKPKHSLDFSEFSPIGCGTCPLAGQLLSGLYEDAFFVIGDGAFLNTPGYIIDLTNAIATFPSMRVLFLLMNDNRYTNVAVDEKVSFGHFTNITSSYDIQKNIDCFSLCSSLMGSKLVKSLYLKDVKNCDIKPLKRFTYDWYNKKCGYKEGGFYFIYYETFLGTPYVENVPV